ncbi:MAG: pentapeptide repeat-containing protein [Pseudomonadota bacterium]
MPISTIVYIGFGVIFYLLALRFTWEFLSQKSPTADRSLLKYFGLGYRLSFWILAGIAAYFTVAAFMALSFIISASAIIYLIFNPVDPSPGTGFSPIFRATIALTAQTTVLGALVTLPITLRRTELTREANETADEGLLTDRINKAVESLGVTKETRTQLEDDQKKALYEKPDGTLTTDKAGSDGAYKPVMIQKTEPNIEVRIGALLSLERIAQQRLDWHVHIMEIICAYIRENAPASDAEDLPQEVVDDPSLFRNDSKVWTDWKAALPATRGDIAIGLQIIGRRSSDQRLKEAEAGNGDGVYPFDYLPQPITLGENKDSVANKIRKYYSLFEGYKGYRPDLSRTNLQCARLIDFNFNGVLLNEAVLQGAWLDRTKMNGADFLYAKLDGARLVGAYFRKAQVRHASLQGALFIGTDLRYASIAFSNLQFAILDDPKIYRFSHVNSCSLRGARLRSFSGETMMNFSDYFDEFFGAKGMMKGNPNRPAHWEQEDSDDFYAAYQAWLEKMRPIWAEQDREAAEEEKAKRA